MDEIKEPKQKFRTTRIVKDAIIKKNNVKEHDGYRCVYCGCINKLLLTIDHKIPKCRGGADEESNMQVCCWGCNQLKGNLTDEEFRLYLPAMEVLKDLCKIKIVFPDRLQVNFSVDYYPCFLPKKLENPFGDRYPPKEV